LAYPLKERNTKTATPYSKRAKEGTAILYKTLEIIEYFKKKNPDLLFVIENPRGMMREDKRIKKFMRSTTCYCLYTNPIRKTTDFFNNFDLQLKEPAPCPNKPTEWDDLNLEERYRIPPKLITTILKQMIDKYKKE
jgi:hypothetical protein